MSKTANVNARIDGMLDRRVKAFQRETGMPASEQVRRALAAWLTEQEQFRAQLRKSLDARKGAK